MKRHVNLGLVYTLCLLVFTTACSEKEEAIINEIQKEDIQKILSDMKEVGDAEGKMVVFELNDYEREDYVKSFELVQNTEKVMAFASGSDDYSKGPGDNYTVTCSWGNGDTTVTECGESTGCAGAATWDCLENGGCTTICNAKITYTPSLNPNKTVKNTKPLEQLQSILEKVEKMGLAKKQSLSFVISRNKDSYKLKSVSPIKKNTQENSAKNGRTFQVDCYDGEGEIIWQETYYDKLSASRGILKCTDEDGGCAEICEIYAAFYP